MKEIKGKINEMGTDMLKGLGADFNQMAEALKRTSRAGRLSADQVIDSARVTSNHSIPKSTDEMVEELQEMDEEEYFGEFDEFDYHLEDSILHLSYAIPFQGVLEDRFNTHCFYDVLGLRVPKEGEYYLNNLFNYAIISDGNIQERKVVVKPTYQANTHTRYSKGKAIE